MVQLKGHRQLPEMPTYSISIPYGAIKSSTGSLTPYRLLLISIPYGAIKRSIRKV